MIVKLKAPDLFLILGFERVTVSTLKIRETHHVNRVQVTVALLPHRDVTLQIGELFSKLLLAGFRSRLSTCHTVGQCRPDTT